MICDICGNDNAIMHIRQIMDGKNDMSLNLCESCAVKNGFQIGQENSIHIPALLEKLKNYNPSENRQKGGRARGPVREVISQAEYRKALEKKLEQAVSIEDYESAAVIRDKIKALVE